MEKAYSSLNWYQNTNLEKKKKNVLFCSKKGFSQVTGILKLGGRGRQLLEHRPELHLPQICPSFLAAGAKRTSGRRQLLCR